jgi:origin recognition complex subunit 1
MDLPERVLVHRVSSRIGLRRLTFQPYTREQLAEIVRTRLDGLDVFSADAIDLCSRKVAAVSGDARRALDLCRRAAELAQTRGGHVELGDIQQALKEMSSSPIVAAMESCSLHEQLLLVAILSQFRKSGVEETFFSDALETHGLFCRSRGIAPPSASTVAAICARLGACRILLTESGERDVFQRIRLNCNQDDVMFALRHDPTIKIMQHAPV